MRITLPEEIWISPVMIDSSDFLCENGRYWVWLKARREGVDLWCVTKQGHPTFLYYFPEERFDDAQEKLKILQHGGKVEIEKYNPYEKQEDFF